MGMDVYGIDPASGAGEYFRASIWEWRPIWERMALLCSDLLEKELLRDMAYNSGLGPADQETCNKIAERLEAWLGEQPGDRFGLEHDPMAIRMTLDGRLVSDKELAKNPGLATESPYSVSREELGEFIDFLKSCGGFCVW